MNATLNKAINVLEDKIIKLNYSSRASFTRKDFNLDDCAAARAELEQLESNQAAAIAAAVQAEREACAQECEAMVMYPGGRQKAPKHNDVWAAAAAIRARRNGDGRE